MSITVRLCGYAVGVVGDNRIAVLIGQRQQFADYGIKRITDFHRFFANNSDTHG